MWESGWIKYTWETRAREEEEEGEGDITAGGHRWGWAAWYYAYWLVFCVCVCVSLVSYSIFDSHSVPLTSWVSTNGSLRGTRRQSPRLMCPAHVTVLRHHRGHGQNRLSGQQCAYGHVHESMCHQTRRRPRDIQRNRINDVKSESGRNRALHCARSTHNRRDSQQRNSSYCSFHHHWSQN